MKRLFAILLLMILVLCACEATQPQETAGVPDTTTASLHDKSHTLT